jgi:hypothetical protein
MKPALLVLVVHGVEAPQGASPADAQAGPEAGHEDDDAEKKQVHVFKRYSFLYYWQDMGV